MCRFRRCRNIGFCIGGWPSCGAHTGRDPLLTSDIAEVLSDSEFRILGRADYCVISGGVKIHPELLESLLGPFIALDYCISSVPDPKWGERLVLVVETGSADLSADFIKKAVAVRLNQYKKVLDLGVRTPKEIFSISSFPRTSNGKLDRERYDLFSCPDTGYYRSGLKNGARILHQ